MFRASILAAALAFAALPAHAGVTVTGDYVQDDYDVAGVTLGMQPNEAFGILEQRGFELDERPDRGTQRGPSWNEMVMIQNEELEARSAEESWKRALFRKGKETVVLEFKPLPTGTAVSRVMYATAAPGMTPERFFPAVEAKYGKPARKTARFMTWSDMPLNSGEADVVDGAIELHAREGGPFTNGNYFWGAKASISLKGGRIGLVDPKEMAKDWTPEPETSF